MRAQLETCEPPARRPEVAVRPGLSLLRTDGVAYGNREGPVVSAALSVEGPATDLVEQKWPTGRRALFVLGSSVVLWSAILGTFWWLV